MRAKILMLSGSMKEKNLLRAPQQALNDIAVAFGHSFIMKDQQLDGEAAGWEAGEAQAVLAAASEEAILSFFDAQVRVSTLTLPQGLRDFSLLRIPQFPVITLVSPLKPGLDHAGMAAKAALKIAGDGEAMVWAVASDDNGLWDDAVSRAASPYALSTPEALPLANVISKPLQYPDRHHVFMADDAQGSLLISLYRGLSGAGLAHSVYVSENHKVHTAGGVPGYFPGLFDALYATVALLGDSLALKKEAGCLQASVDNVLASGWRARGMDIKGKTAGDDQIAALIGEQIDLAGSLMQRFPG